MVLPPLLLLAGAAVFFFVVPAYVEKSYNRTSSSPPYQASEKARALLVEGFKDEEIKMIMGGNVLRVLSENLPRE
jgi:microsomal dipeptidase-like Zn-dependent dipeptidase